MTTRKYNMIKKYTYLDGFTFDDIFAYLEKTLNLEKYTAKQIADIMGLCKAQSEYGYNKAYKEICV